MKIRHVLSVSLQFSNFEGLDVRVSFEKSSRVLKMRYLPRLFVSIHNQVIWHPDHFQTLTSINSSAKKCTTFGLSFQLLPCILSKVSKNRQHITSGVFLLMKSVLLLLTLNSWSLAAFLLKIVEVVIVSCVLLQVGSRFY